LTEAGRAGLVEFDGERIRFTHPLIASIPYADLPPAARRRLHGQLADAVSDPEEHARHAALATLDRSAARHRLQSGPDQQCSQPDQPYWHLW
jgi:hypothetical protein